MNAARSLDSENAGHACIHLRDACRGSRENPLRVLGRVRARRLISSYPERNCFQQYTQGHMMPGIANSRYAPQAYPCKQLAGCCAGPTPSQLSTPSPTPSYVLASSVTYYNRKPAELLPESTYLYRCSSQSPSDTQGMRIQFILSYICPPGTLLSQETFLYAFLMSFFCPQVYTQERHAP